MGKSLFIKLLIVLLVGFPCVVGATTISGTDVYEMNGTDGLLEAIDDSTINIYANSDVAYLQAHDNSNINIYGGDISWLELYNNSTTNIYAVDDLSWLLVNDAAEVNIYGYDFTYSEGHLSGYWRDGVAFSFWALEESDLRSGNLEGLIPDNIVLHDSSPVPEPASMLLFGTGIIGLFASRFRKTKNSI